MGSIKHKAVKASGDVLYASEWNDEHSHDLVLNDLTDIEAPTPANKDLLAYESATGKWKNKPFSIFNLGELGDVEIATPADGEVLTYDEATGKWKNKPAPTGAGSRLDLITEVEVASDCDYVDITGLDINTHKFYLMIVKLKNPQTTSGELYIYFEGDYTDANYYSQATWADASSIYAARYNYPLIACNPDRNATVFSVIITRDPDGYPHAFAQEGRYVGADVMYCTAHVSKTNTVTNITEIRIASDVAGGIGAGTKIEIYGYKST